MRQSRRPLGGGGPKPSRNGSGKKACALVIHIGGGNVSSHNVSFFRKMFLLADYGRH